MLMKKIFLLIAAAFVGLIAASAQSAYSYEKFVSSEGQSLNYRLLEPLKVAAKK